MGRLGDAAGAAPLPKGPGFTVAAVILYDARGWVLTVRKRGTDAFMLPGGKLEPGEAPAAAGAREVAEELGLVLDAAALEPVGTFLTAAANEPGHWLRSHVFRHPVPVSGERAAAEIAEARWVDPDAPAGVLAPLFVELLDEIRRRRADGPSR